MKQSKTTKIVFPYVKLTNIFFLKERSCYLKIYLIFFYRKQCCVMLSCHQIIALYKPLWDVIHTLWSSDAICQHISESTLAKIMTCCLTTPRRYLDQCWLLISEVLWCCNFISLYKEFENHNFEITAIYPGTTELISPSLIFHRSFL